MTILAHTQLLYQPLIATGLKTMPRCPSPVTSTTLTGEKLGGKESLTTAALSIEAYALFGGCCIVASIEIPR